mgnify:CR=1 FL=1
MSTDEPKTDVAGATVAFDAADLALANEISPPPVFVPPRTPEEEQKMFATWRASATDLPRIVASADAMTALHRALTAHAVTDPEGVGTRISAEMDACRAAALKAMTYAERSVYHTELATITAKTMLHVLARIGITNESPLLWYVKSLLEKQTHAMMALDAEVAARWDRADLKNGNPIS